MSANSSPPNASSRSRYKCCLSWYVASRPMMQGWWAQSSAARSDMTCLCLPPLITCALRIDLSA
eukprot:scaffold722_cov151-Isochrysis_galbana.AAC.1